MKKLVVLFLSASCLFMGGKAGAGESGPDKTIVASLDPEYDSAVQEASPLRFKAADLVSERINAYRHKSIDFPVRVPLDPNREFVVYPEDRFTIENDPRYDYYFVCRRQIEYFKNLYIVKEIRRLVKGYEKLTKIKKNIYYSRHYDRPKKLFSIMGTARYKKNTSVTNLRVQTVGKNPVSLNLNILALKGSATLMLNIPF